MFDAGTIEKHKRRNHGLNYYSDITGKARHWRVVNHSDSRAPAKIHYLGHACKYHTSAAFDVENLFYSPVLKGYCSRYMKHMESNMRSHGCFH